MKSLDVDAKHLIRNYVDSIEEYLRNKGNLHPNEIDSLLNEINDFIHLRSRELSEEDRVHYDVVLKAIDECGSPSEIGDAFLELQEEGGSSEDFWKRIGVSSPMIDKLNLSKASSATSHPSTPPKSVYQEKIADSRIQARNYFSVLIQSISNSYGKSLIFIFYRFFFLYFISFIFISLIVSRPEDIFSYYFDIAPYYINPELIILDVNGASYLTNNLLSTYTIASILLVFWEGIVIHRIKTWLHFTRSFNRRIDDALIIWVSRFGFLLLLFKGAALYVPYYIFFLPVWIILFVLLERQLNSVLWAQRIAPWITNFGLSLTNPSYKSDSQNKPSFPNLEWFRYNMTIPQRILFIFTFLLFLIMMLFPFTFLSITTYSSQTWTRSGYDIAGLWYYVTIFNQVGIGVIALTIFYSVIVRFQKHILTTTIFNHGSIFEAGLQPQLWLNRLVLLQMGVITWMHGGHFDYIPLAFLIISLFFLSELFLSKTDGSLIKTLFAAFLLTLSGAESSEKIKPIDATISPTSFGKPTQIIPSEKLTTPNLPSFQKMISPLSKQENKVKSTTPSPPSVQEPPSTLIASKKGRLTRFLFFFFKSIGRFLKNVFTVFYPFIRAITITLAIFIATIYEIVIMYVILVTGNNVEGYYVIPTFSIDLSFLVGFPYVKQLGPYTVWVYYALILVAIHAFIVIFLGMYSLFQRDQEGSLLRIGRGLTRIYLLWMFLYLLIWGWVWDIFIQIRLMCILLITFFFEIANLKIRSDRKRLGLVIPKPSKTSKKSVKNEI